MSKLSIVFFGTPEFATSSLALIENHFEIKAVVTSTDKKSGRGKKIKFSHIKSYCIDNKRGCCNLSRFKIQFLLII